MSTVSHPAVVAGRLKSERKVRRAHARSGHGSKGGWLVESLVVLLCVLWLVPTVGLFLTSLRPPSDANTNGWWNLIANPTRVTLQNYQAALTTGSFPLEQAFVNSLTVAVPATVIPILIAAFAAYVFTFMEFKGRDLLFIVVVGLLVVPNQVALVPLMVLFAHWGIQGTFAAVWIAHTGFGMPLAVYILRNFMATLPKTVIESARIDGATHYQTFWRLIVPMSVPALASFAIFQFLWVWNDLLVALMLLGSGQNMVLTQAIASLVGGLGQGWQLITAAAFISMIVPMIVFFSLQRFFIRGLTSGAVKG